MSSYYKNFHLFIWYEIINEGLHMNLLPNSCIIAKENEGHRVFRRMSFIFVFRAKYNTITSTKKKKKKPRTIISDKAKKLFLDGLELLNKNYIVLLGKGVGLGLRRV